MSYINEHLPIVLANNLAFFTYLAILIAVFAFTDSKLKLSDGFLIFGLLIMTISSRRNLYLLLPLTAVPVVSLIDVFIKKNTNNLKVDEINVKLLNNFYYVICIIILGICIYNFVSLWNDDYINEELYPVKATEWLKNYLDVENIKIYNDYDYGSYMLWQGVPVFIDSRCDLYTEQFNKGVTVFNDCMEVESGEVTYDDMFEKYGITHVLIYKDSIVNTYMSQDEDYELLYEDDNFVIYKYNADNVE